MSKISIEDTIHQIETKMIDDGIEKRVVGGVIFVGTKILVCQRAKEEYLAGLVELPSGNVDNGEKIIEGLEREIFEETGLKVKEIKKYLGYFDYVSGSGKKARQVNFVVECYEGDIILNPLEHEEYYLLEANQMDDYNISNSTKSIISAAFIWLENRNSQ